MTAFRRPCRDAPLPADHRAPGARCCSDPALRHRNRPSVRHHCPRAGREILQSARAWTTVVSLRRRDRGTLVARPVGGRRCRASRDPVGGWRRRVAGSWATLAAPAESALPPNQSCPRSRGAGRRATVGVRWASRRRCRPQPDRRLEPFPVTQRVVPSRQHPQHLVGDRCCSGRAEWRPPGHDRSTSALSSRCSRSLTCCIWCFGQASRTQRAGHRETSHYLSTFGLMDGSGWTMLFLGGVWRIAPN